MTKKKNRNKINNKEAKETPFVSICTPTFNRRPFIKSMIKCFNHQTYPKSQMEWIIIDDGTDKIEDLVKDIPQVKYYYYENQMVLGKKRNLMHEKAKGDIIVYMDDDDYYPPSRVSHAVNMLLTHPKALCAGASEIYIYFKHVDKMIQFGPYGESHATAGTFAFRRELLEHHSYDDNAALAEEKAFLKNYTVPFVQLEPKKTILVFSHIHNTFDKKTLLENPNPNFVRETNKVIDDFIKEKDLKNFYLNEIEDLLKDYELGEPKMKPIVLEQIKKISLQREALWKEHMKKQQMLSHNSNMNNQNGNKEAEIVAEINGERRILKQMEILEILKNQQSLIEKLSLEIKMKDEKIKNLEQNKIEIE